MHPRAPIFLLHLCHPATPTAVWVPSLHPPPLILKGQGSSPCQMEFIHSCSPTNVFLTKSAVRVGECRALGKTTSLGFLCLSSFLTAATLLLCLPLETSLFVLPSLTYYAYIYACTWVDIDSFIVSSFGYVFLICLQVSRRKHVMRFSLNPAIILTQSSVFLALLHIIWLHRGIPWCCLCKLVCQTPYTWRRNREGEGKESVAINITSLHRLLKMLSLSA